MAVGARQFPAYPHVGTFGDAEADDTYQGVVQDVEGGYAKSMAFRVPEGPVYPLPIYELALMTAERATAWGSKTSRCRWSRPSRLRWRSSGSRERGGFPTTRGRRHHGLRRRGCRSSGSRAAARPASGSRAASTAHGGDAATGRSGHPRSRRRGTTRLHSDRPLMLGAGNDGPHLCSGRCRGLSGQAQRTWGPDGRHCSQRIALLAGADVEYTEFLPTIRGRCSPGRRRSTSARAW
jgi:hypothetical protein